MILRNIFKWSFLAVISSCSSAPKVVIQERPWQKLMSKGYVQTSLNDFGKRIEIRIWPQAKSKVPGSQSLTLAKNEIKRIAALADSTLKTSLLYQVNEKAFETPVPITQEFLDILTECDRMFQQTEGKFDVSYVPYKFGDQETDLDLNKVTDWDSKPALSSNPIHLLGKKNVIVDQNPLRVRIYNRRTKLNLNGMIRGYAIDRAARILAGQGNAGFAIIADGFFVASGVGLRDPGLMCVENPQQLGTCLKPISVQDTNQVLFFGLSASLERRGVNFDPTETWSARSGGVLVAGQVGAWVQFASTITAVMDNMNLIAFFQKAQNPKISGVYFTPGKINDLAGNLAPFAKLGN